MIRFSFVYFYIANVAEKLFMYNSGNKCYNKFSGIRMLLFVPQNTTKKFPTSLICNKSETI